MVFSGAWGKLIHEKKKSRKISWHCPFNSGIRDVALLNRLKANFLIFALSDIRLSVCVTLSNICQCVCVALSNICLPVCVALSNICLSVCVALSNICLPVCVAKMGPRHLGLIKLMRSFSKDVISYSVFWNVQISKFNLKGSGSWERMKTFCYFSHLFSSKPRGKWQWRHHTSEHFEHLKTRRGFFHKIVKRKNGK